MAAQCETWHVFLGGVSIPTPTPFFPPTPTPLPFCLLFCLLLDLTLVALLSLCRWNVMYWCWWRWLRLWRFGVCNDVLALGVCNDVLALSVRNHSTLRKIVGVTARRAPGPLHSRLLGFCKLHAPVYDILPPTTAIIGRAIGLQKLPANDQFFPWCSNSSRFVTDNTDYTMRFCYNRPHCVRQHK